MFTTLTALVVMQAAVAQAPTAQPAAQAGPPRCNTEEYASFDFWLGEWDVFPNGSETKVADSRIERLHNGCAVQENWMPLSGASGGSFNAYDPVTERWHQLWIGSSPGRVEFEGGPVEGGMVMTGYWRGVNGPGTMGLVRMTYTLGEDGSVRQHGEVSTDHGKTWSNSFDFIYRKKVRDSE